jgi:hypothetical protein
MVIWSNDKMQLLEMGKKFEQYIVQELKLILKPFCLNSVDKGLPFLGYLLYPDKTRLRKTNKQRFEAKFSEYNALLCSGEWSQQEYQQHILPLLAFVRYADSRKLLSKNLPVADK